MALSLMRRASVVLLVLVAAGSIAMAAQPLFKGGEQAPSDAIVLFDGKDLSRWVMAGSDKAPTWKVVDGYCTPQDGDICSKQHFNDCQLHVEFWVPLMPDAQGQARGNSGVFLKGFTYEVQVLDSYGLESKDNDCGAVYTVKAPLVNACRPPETWQSYDIIFHAPKFDESGKKIANARITVFQNGVLIQDNTEVPYPTPNHSGVESKDPGPIELQWHHNPVRFRNVWVRPL